MELTILSFIFFLFSFFGYWLDRKILNPLFVMPLLWSMLLLLYAVIPHNLYPLQEQFLLSILLWVSFFFLGGILFLRNKTITISINLYNRKIFNLYFYIVIVAAPVVIFLLIEEAIKAGAINFFLRLRIINTGLEEGDTFSLGVWGYVFNFANTVCLLFTYYYERISKWKYYIVLILAFLLGLITLARTSLVVLSLAIFVILYFKGLLKRKHYWCFIGVFVAFMVLVTMLRSFHEEGGINAFDTISGYLLAGMPAFDTLTYYLEEQIGSYTFRFIYAVANVLGANYQLTHAILPYTYTPVTTNVYTVMFPFYKDFGYIGVGFFSFIYGAIYTFIYRKGGKNAQFFVLLYAMFFPYILLQFMGEFIFTVFSSHLQSVIFLLIPYFLKFKR